MNDDARDAARQLLKSPLVLAAIQPDEHRRIRRHAEDLVSMFRSYLGYRLVVDARLARLYKAGLGETEQRALVVRSSQAPFSARDYTYLALLCSVLLSTGQQVLLSALVADVEQAATEASVELDQDTRSDRFAFVHALRQLIAWGAIVEVDGTVGGYADGKTTEVLLTIERDVIREILAVRLRDVEDPRELIHIATEVAPEAIRHRARRRLVECPVVMLSDLPEPERAWLRQSQRREAQLLEDNIGLRLEIRAEGMAAFDPSDELTDVSFPRDGTVAQAALLAVSRLVEDAGTGAAPVVMLAPHAMATVTASLLRRHGKGWAKEYLDRPDRLVTDVEELLLAMGLVVRGPDGQLMLRAVAARYAPESTGYRASEQSLSLDVP